MATPDDPGGRRGIVWKVLGKVEGFEFGRKLLCAGASLVGLVFDTGAVGVRGIRGTRVIGGGEAHGPLMVNVMVVTVVVSPSPFTAIVTHSVCVATSVSVLLLDLTFVLCCDQSSVNAEDSGA